eukprot:5977683-Pleurochrysis_carterae.AAC.1
MLRQPARDTRAYSVCMWHTCTCACSESIGAFERAACICLHLSHREQHVKQYTATMNRARTDASSPLWVHYPDING